MMAWELRDNSGTLFKNSRKTKPTHPNATGTCMIDGKVYEVSAWTKEGNKGPFQSLAFKLKEDSDNDYSDDSSRRSNGNGNRSSNGNASRRPPPNFADMDDDIPF
jgi:hypothetical protein